jgi:hypothetical protein
MDLDGNGDIDDVSFDPVFDSMNHSLQTMALWRCDLNRVHSVHSEAECSVHSVRSQLDGRNYVATKLLSSLPLLSSMTVDAN